jgi:hypothetical protein
VKDAVQLEVDLVLGGGNLKGKARFPVSDGLEPTSALNPKIEIEAKLPPKTDIASMALKSDGSSDFSSFDPPYTCQRQVPTGCAAWNDHGVAYIAVSLVSFDNVLKIVYGDQHRSP